MVPSALAIGLVAASVGLAPQPAPPDLKHLADLAARYRIPLPPKDAPVVLAFLVAIDHYRTAPGDKPTGIYAPAFLLEEKPDGSVVVLRGTERHTIANGKPNLRPFTVERVKGAPGGYETRFMDTSTFACAVQLAARGEYAAARALLKRFHEDNPAWSADDPGHLARMAFDHHSHRLLLGTAT